MTDITKCGTTSCPLADKCYRKIAPDDIYAQGYAYFVYSDKDGKIECSHFYERGK